MNNSDEYLVDLRNHTEEMVHLCTGGLAECMVAIESETNVHSSYGHVILPYEENVYQLFRLQMEESKSNLKEEMGLLLDRCVFVEFYGDDMSTSIFGNLALEEGNTYVVRDNESSIGFKLKHIKAINESGINTTIVLKIEIS